MSGNGRPPQRRRLPGPAALWVGVGAFALFELGRLFPRAVESVYGRTVYPPLATTLARMSAPLPFSLAEWVYAGAAVSLIAAGPSGYISARRQFMGRGAALRKGAARLGAFAGAWWTLFLVLWGFNYARPLPDPSFGIERSRPAKERIEELTAAVSRRLDAERALVAEDAAGVAADQGTLRELDDHLRDLQVGVLRDAGLPVVDGGRTKKFLLSPLMLRWGVSGTYGIFTGEPNVVWPSMPALLPFTMAHERAHLSGFAQEEDASFVGLLTCWRSPRAEVRYAGWLSLYLELRRDPAALSAPVKRDILAISKFLETYRGREAGAIWKTYSGYLKLQGVKGGIRSYGRVAGLALRWLDTHGFPGETAATTSPGTTPSP